MAHESEFPRLKENTIVQVLHQNDPSYWCTSVILESSESGFGVNIACESPCSQRHWVRRGNVKES